MRCKDAGSVQIESWALPRTKQRAAERAPAASCFILKPVPSHVLAAARQARSLEETAHRPWPLPDEPWALAQSLSDQLFLHWPVPADKLRPLLPPEIEVDTFAGEAWLGITAFAVSTLRVRGTLPLPFVSSFLQMNVRTYVTASGAPGIWFLSLDVSSPFAHAAGRWLYELPLHRARISLTRRGNRLDVSLTRRDHAAPPLVLEAHLEAFGPAVRPPPGSLEHFLTERYRVYMKARGRFWQAELHHRPWSLRQARGRIEPNSIGPGGLEFPEVALYHVSSQMDTLLWPRQPVAV